MSSDINFSTSDPIDHFDRIPDSILLEIFNKICNVEDLAYCCLVSKRFQNLIPSVENVIVRADSLTSDDLPCGFSNNNGNGGGRTDDVFLNLARHFKEIKKLKIELPCCKIAVEDLKLLKWKANFGSTLDRCVILVASSTMSNETVNCSYLNDNGGIPHSRFTRAKLDENYNLLIAASAMHFWLWPIIKDHETLESLDLTDSTGQGVLSMNKLQLKEARHQKPVIASGCSQRTLVPEIHMKLWFASFLEIPGGNILKAATLIVTRPCAEFSDKCCDDSEELCGEGSWVSNAFEEPYRTAAKMLVKRWSLNIQTGSF